jgi:hypothetical protein
MLFNTCQPSLSSEGQKSIFRQVFIAKACLLIMKQNNVILFWISIYISSFKPAVFKLPVNDIQRLVHGSIFTIIKFVLSKSQLYNYVSKKRILTLNFKWNAFLPKIGENCDPNFNFQVKRQFCLPKIGENCDPNFNFQVKRQFGLPKIGESPRTIKL